MKTIKNIALLVSVCVAVLMATGCDNDKPPVDEPTIELPDNDRLGYSDVYTIYNTYKKDDCSQVGPTGKTIRITGWIVQPGGDVEKMDCNAFYLTDKPDQTKIDDAILITTTPENADILKFRYNNSLADGCFDREPEIRRKCFIKGELVLETLNEDGRSIAVPSIKIIDINNFRVENEMPPKVPSPIDWEGYNDVYTVYWNYLVDNLQAGPTGKVIKIKGIVANPYNDDWAGMDFRGFYVANDPSQTDLECGYVFIRSITPEIAKQLQTAFFENGYFGKRKCDITGNLILELWDGGVRYGIEPVIEITDANNVIFE